MNNKLLKIYRGVNNAFTPNIEGAGRAEWWTVDYDDAYAYGPDADDEHEGAVLTATIDLNKFKVLSVHTDKSVTDLYLTDKLNSAADTEIIKNNDSTVIIKDLKNNKLYNIRKDLDSLQVFYNSRLLQNGYDIIYGTFRLSNRLITEIALLKDNMVEYDAPSWYNKNWRQNKDTIKESKYMNILKEAPELAGSKINLLKYGFVRAPQEDFSDDGNRFICYYYDPNHSGDQRIRLSKLVDNKNNQAYISANYSNPESGKSTYFDDLNGVSIADAITGLPKLKADLDHFLDNIAELDVVVRLSDDDIAKYAQLIGPISGGLNSTAGMAILKDAGIDYQALDRNSKEKLITAVKDATPIDKEAVKEAAKDYLKRILANMKPHKEGWGRNERWVEAKPLDQLLVKVYPITEFSDAIQDKIIAWAKDRVEKLYDFDI